MPNTVLISIFTSLVVSLITFILGLKAGKNQADRTKLQSLYLDMLNHFNEIKERLIEGYPKRWSDYKKIETVNSIKYYPLMKDYQTNGNMIYINKRIFKDAIELEKECLSYEYSANKLIEKIHNNLVKNEDIFKDGIKLDRNNRNSSVVFTGQNEECNTYRTYSYHEFFNEENIINIIDEQKHSEKKYALSFSTRENPPDFKFILYPDKLNISSSEFLCLIKNTLNEESKEYSELVKLKNTLIQKINKLNKRIERRAQEPVSFWETFFGSFADLFRWGYM